MQAESDAKLLRDYAERGVERAFTEIVNRHTNLVYSAALRQVDSPDVAADVAQQAFLGLARGARSLSGKLAGDASLAGWLCRSARNISLNLRRDEFRRHSRERQAMQPQNLQPETAPDWDCVRLVLDESMAELSEPDYDALVLRFFRNQDLRSVGLALGVSADTAQKRVARALDKLRELISRRGLSTTAAALSLVISANAVQTAPVGLAVTISTAAALAGTITTATIATHTTMNWLNLKSIAAIVAAALAAGTGTHLVQKRETNRLRIENQNLITQQETLTSERDAALPVATASTDELERLQKDKNELLRLRGEIGLLRQQQSDVAKMREKDLRILNAASVSPTPNTTNTNGIQFFQRRYNINAGFLENLNHQVKAIGEESTHDKLRSLFEQNGVTFAPPASFFFNDKKGEILAYHSLTNLDAIETILGFLDTAK